MKKTNKYAEIKLEIAQLTEQMRVLEAEILKDMGKNGLEQVETNYGLISKVHRKTWSYSETVAKLAAKLKERKQIEEIKGIATFIENLGLMFRPN